MISTSAQKWVISTIRIGISDIGIRIRGDSGIGIGADIGISVGTIGISSWLLNESFFMIGGMRQTHARNEHQLRNI